MINQGSSQQGKWAGRNPDKDILRHEIWGKLESEGAGIGKIWSAIPNFVGAEQAADQLTKLPFWESAQIVKTNPDIPQAPIRLRALQQGKLVYTPVPALVKDYPFILLDPVELQKRGIPFEDVITAEGSIKHGQRVKFHEMQPMDILVVGCVAVTRNGGRTGKGAGFADLEMGIFREYALIKPEAPILTTVHSIQVVEDERIVMMAHDTPLDWVITPDEIIETHTIYPQPGRINWDDIQADQYENIPFLRDLKQQLSNKQ